MAAHILSLLVSTSLSPCLCSGATACLPGQPTDFFSWSTGDYWLSHDWSWSNTSALFKQDWGLPTGLAVRSGSVWTREYERAKISLDCATLKPSIQMIRCNMVVSQRQCAVCTSSVILLQRKSSGSFTHERQRVLDPPSHSHLLIRSCISAPHDAMKK